LIPTHEQIFRDALAIARFDYRVAMACGCGRDAAMREVHRRIGEDLVRAKARYRRVANKAFSGRVVGAIMRLKAHVRRAEANGRKRGGETA